MNSQQEKRFQKIFTEPLYLIEYKVDQNQIDFMISGSTKNVYRISMKNCQITCDCQDATTWCKKFKVVCKHVCFVLFRVLKLLRDTTIFFENLKLSEEEEKLILSWISKKQIGEDVFNESLRDKYLQKIQDPKQISLFSKSDKVFENSDECPICYDLLLNEIKLLSCPDCKNYVHETCMEKWLQYNHTCVYCRSNSWAKFIDEKSSKYVNLN
jgi:hypothetical protein